MEDYNKFLKDSIDYKKSREDQLTPEQKHVKSIFEDIRAKILDRGNTQIRSLESEFVNYEISKKKYFINLPVAKSKGEEDGK